MFSLSCIYFLSVGYVHSLIIDGCPLFGCRPSGSFSFYLDVPRSDVSIRWQSQFVLDPVPYALGCVADSVNIVCPSNGPFTEDKGYVSLYNENGTIRWRDSVLHFPTLPLLDNYGDVTGSDGVNLVHYDQDGKTYPVIKCYGLKPMFNMQLVGTMYLLLVSERGGLVVRDTNAIPVAEIFLNDTVQRTNGTFLPISQPVVNGQRFYLLTEFVPDSDEFELSVLNLQRLYAIDIHDRPAEIMTIAWYFNFEMEDRTIYNTETLLRSDKVKLMEESLQNKQNILWDYTTQTVYISLPPPYLSSPDTTNTFWALQDMDNRAALKIRSVLDILHLATFEADSYEGHTVRDESSVSSLWAGTADAKFYEIVADGNVSRVLDVASLLGKNVAVTSKVSLVRENDSATDILLFGAKLTSQNTRPSTLEDDSSSVVVALDTSGPDGMVLWTTSVPDGYDIKGQISGFNGVFSDNKAQIIAYIENNRSAKFISLQ